MRSAVVLVVMSALLALTGCSKKSATSVAPTIGQMKVMMTDAPAPYDAVNLVVSEVSANSGSGWQVLSTGATAVDLLSLSNGVFATLADGAVPAGGYNQVRLLLAPGSNVVVGGVTYPLNVPSGLQSGLKLNGAFEVPAGGVLSLQMDFDAAKSIHQNGAGDYILDPVIRMIPASEAGAIAGLVAPASLGATVQVFQGDVELTTTLANTDGSFKVAVLPAGTYLLRVTTGSGTTMLVRDVVVVAGQTTSVGTISFVSSGTGKFPGKRPGGGS